MANQMNGDIDETVAASRVIGLDLHPQSPGCEADADARVNKFSPGDLLSNRFLIIRFVGAGGMGEVYEAQDRLLQGATIALKTISHGLATLPDAKERFEREVLLARQVTHANVCPIYDIYYHRDELGSCCFLCMKFLAGETLARRLSGRGLGGNEALSIVRQTAAALQAAHCEGILHRDIKPSNIMLEGAGETVKAVVTDFGLARRFDSDHTSTGTVSPIGTPGYIAPELFKGQAASVASDLYSFGLVVLEIYTGKKPSDFQGQHPLKFTPLLSARHVPVFIPYLVAGCLSDDPERRTQAFQLALRHLRPDAGVRQPRAALKLHLSRRRMLGGAIAAGCVGVGAAIWEKDSIAEWLSPLPRKRFVALVSWPNSDSHLTPVLSGVLDAIERELSRAEAFDRDLYVVTDSSPIKDSAQLSRVRDSLGANLVLASSAVAGPQGVILSLKILDTAIREVLRQRLLTCSMDEISVLPRKAVHAAAELLGVSRFIQSGDRMAAGTKSAEAYQHFQAGEALIRKPNGEGLDDAIEQYKIALEQDSQYANAYASLAMAYCNQYGARRELAALDLARANAEAALAADTNQIGAHLALSVYWRYRGQNQFALDEMHKALNIDPSNSRTILWEAQLLARMQRFAEAELAFQRLLKLRPNYWAAYNELGEVFSRQGKYSQALLAYRSASLANPKSALALANVGQYCMILGRLKEARQNLERSMALSPSGYAAAVLAEELRAEGDITGALKYARQAIQLDASDVENWLELGDCLSVITGHTEDARKAYRQGLDVAQLRVSTDSSDGPAWMLIALLQAKTGDVSSARVTIGKAESAGATELDSQLFKVRILEIAGQRSKALESARACFQRGATVFQFDSMPDLESLRADPLYRKILKIQPLPGGHQ
jgi:serine/threonine protein kinase/tetratricopeptide (TPR) repeat protein